MCMYLKDKHVGKLVVSLHPLPLNFLTISYILQNIFEWIIWPNEPECSVFVALALQVFGCSCSPCCSLCIQISSNSSARAVPTPLSPKPRRHSLSECFCVRQCVCVSLCICIRWSVDRVLLLCGGSLWPSGLMFHRTLGKPCRLPLKFSSADIHFDALALLTQPTASYNHPSLKIGSLYKHNPH